MASLKCEKCQSKALYLDRDITGNPSIACVMCGHRHYGKTRGIEMKDTSEQTAGVKSNERESERTEISERLCELCGERKTAFPHVRFCPRCLGKKGAKARIANLAPKAAALKNAGEAPPAPEKAPQNRNTKVMVDFSRHEELLKRVEEMAEEELRPLELQILSLVKRHFADYKKWNEK